MSRSLHALALAAGLVVLFSAPASADPAKCQNAILAKLRKFKKVYLKKNEKCLDLKNRDNLNTACPDTDGLLKIQTTNQSVADAIASACTMSDIAALGFPSDCAFESVTGGKEGQCAALPVTTPTEFAECLKCWKAAELSEFLAILYASQANGICGGSLGESSPVCSDLDCSTPLPDQRNLGDTGENDCQRGIGKGGVKYFLSREKVLEKCAGTGGTRASCLADLTVQTALQKAQTKKDATIMKKCGNRVPEASPPFCCRTGTGNSCSVPSPDTREQCVTDGGQVQEDKVCGGGGTCDPTPGMKRITWWESCPEAACGAQPLATLGDLITCVDTSADGIVDELLCQQIRSGGWPCPAETGSPSGAFLEAF